MDTSERAAFKLLDAASVTPQEQNFNRYSEGMLVKQTMRGCLCNALGCQSKQEYFVSGVDYKFLATTGVQEGTASLPNDMYILENSSCCCRLFWRDGRPLQFNVSMGAEEGGPPVARYTKPCGCPLYFRVPVPVNQEGDVAEVNCPCCCFLPSLSLEDGKGGEASRSEYLCRYNSCCIPQLMYYEQDEPVYFLAPDTCCAGLCIQCKGGGKGAVCAQVPFYFRDPVTEEKLPAREGQAPQISKLWSGLTKEFCTTADNFAVMFPDGIDNKRKAGLLGLTLLLDFTVFERQGETPPTEE